VLSTSNTEGTRWATILTLSVQAADDQEAAAVAPPDSRIILVCQLGRPSPSFVEKLVAEEPTVQAGLTGTGERDSFGPDGILANEHFDTLTSILEHDGAE
jgi:hypothetical protein